MTAPVLGTSTSDAWRSTLARAANLSVPLNFADITFVRASQYQPESPLANDLTGSVGSHQSVTGETESDRAPRWRRQRDEQMPGIRSITGLHKWEERIVDLDESTFTVEMSSADGKPSVLADFNLELLGVSSEVRVDDVVYVTTRMVRSARGVPPTQTVSVRRRRLGKWTAEELSAADSRVSETWSKLAQIVD